MTATGLHGCETVADAYGAMTQASTPSPNQRGPRRGARMNAPDRRAIIDAAHAHAAKSAQAQGLPATVTDPDVLRQVATLINPTPRRAAA